MKKQKKRHVSECSKRGDKLDRAFAGALGKCADTGEAMIGLRKALWPERARLEKEWAAWDAIEARFAKGLHECNAARRALADFKRELSAGGGGQKRKTL